MFIPLPTSCINILLLLGLLVLSTTTHDNVLAEATPSSPPHVRRQTTTTTRIVGGEQVPASAAYPFFVEWHNSGCGGSLVHDDIMLTASHCFFDANPFLRVVYIGGTRRGSGAVMRTMTRQLPHPLWNADSNLEYDFMLVKLNASAVGAEGVSTISFNTMPDIPRAGDPLTVIGYGVTSSTSHQLPQNLRHVQVTAIDEEQCEDYYQNTFPILSQVMFCAGSDDLSQKDSCQGDSGGPIIDVDTTGNFRQVGVVSFGESCGAPQFPGVYSRVSAVTEWIQEQICLWSCYPPSHCDGLPKNECALSGTGVPVGQNNLTLVFAYDSFPSETAILLEHVETATELLFLDYDHKSDTTSTTIERYSFTNQPNGTYRIVVGDTGRDGINGRFGNGNITLLMANNDATTSTDNDAIVIWFHNGTFQSLLEDFVTVPGEAIDIPEPVTTTTAPGVMGDAGSSLGIGLGPDLGSDNIGSSSSSGGGGDDEQVGFQMDLSDYEDIIHQGNLVYPEPNATHTLVINIQYDAYPQQTDWNLEQFTTEDEKWVSVGGGLELPASIISNGFSSYPREGLESDTLYRFVVTDSQSNGMGSTGWVALTNGTIADDDAGTVMWVLRGDEFQSSATAPIWVDAVGNLIILSNAEAQQLTGGSTTMTVQQGGGGIDVAVAPPGESMVAGEKHKKKQRQSSHASGWDVEDP